MTTGEKIGITIGVGLIGFALYKHFVAIPNVQVERLNWDTGEADILTKGQLTTVTENKVVELGNGYTVAFAKAFRSGSTVDALARLEILQNGKTKKIIAQY